MGNTDLRGGRLIPVSLEAVPGTGPGLWATALPIRPDGKKVILQTSQFLSKLHFKYAL